MSIIFDLLIFCLFYERSSYASLFGGEFKYRSLWWYAETLIFGEVVRAGKNLRTTVLDNGSKT